MNSNWKLTNLKTFEIIKQSDQDAKSAQNKRLKEKEHVGCVLNVKDTYANITLVYAEYAMSVLASK